MDQKFAKLRFKEFAKVAAIGGALALTSTAATATPVNVGGGTGRVTVNAGNAIWFLNNDITFPTTSSDWGFSEASLHTASGTRHDAFDGALSWLINSVGGGYVSPSGTIDITPYPITSSVGTTVTGAPQTLAGLTVTGQQYFSPVKAVVRSIFIMQNPTDAPITVTVENASNRGSDANTYYQATSSGDQAFDPTDNWFVSSETATPTKDNDPILTFAFQQTGASVRGTPNPAPANGNDRFFEFYTVTIPAGQTRRLMIFVQMSDTVANAEADAPLFNSISSLQGTDYLSGLSQTELSEIVNWNLIATPTLSLSSAANPSVYAQNVSFSASFTGSVNPTGTVSICADDATCANPSAMCSAPISGTSATCDLTGLTAGSHSITASYAGDVNNSAAASSPLVQQVDQAGQVLTFGAAPSIVVGGTAAVSATSATPNSGNSILYSTTSTDCSVDASSGLVTGINAGTNNCVITATQAADSNYTVGTATQTISIGQASQLITFGAQAAQSFHAGATFALNPLASASSGLPVSYASNSMSVCTISNTTVTIVSAGTCVIAASQSGNNNYAAASSVVQNIAIGVAPTTITLAVTPNPATVGQTVSLSATVSGDPPTGSVNFYDGATLLGTATLNAGTPDQASFSTKSLAAGTHSLTATYSGDANHAASATTVATSEVVNAVPAIPAVPAPTLGRWALLMLGGLMAAVARIYRRSAKSR